MEELKDLIRGFLSRPSLAKNYRKAQIAHAWSEIVGEEIAAKTRPGELNRGVLKITCANSVWANELSLMSAKIVEEINKVVGKQTVKRLTFRT